jgi:integrase
VQRSVGVEGTAWTESELRAFPRAAAGHRCFPILWLAANTGMRRNELVGLKWTDIDFSRQRLALDRGLVAIGYEIHETRGKTKTARRNIALGTTTMTVLAGWRAVQAAEFAAVGIDNTEQWMFTNGDGDVVHPHAIYQAFTRIVNNAGVRRIRFHDLRHTHGSLLIQAGVPVKVVSERLGHANIAFTMQTYQHLLPGMQENAANITEQLSTPVPPAATTPVEGRGNTRRKTA